MLKFMDCHIFIVKQTRENELQNDKPYKMIRAPSEDSDQPGHLISLIRVFSVPLGKQSSWFCLVAAQADITTLLLSYLCCLKMLIHDECHIFIVKQTRENELGNDKTYKMTCAPSENSDQPGHLPSLIRVFSVPLGKQQSWFCLAMAQADITTLLLSYQSF